MKTKNLQNKKANKINLTIQLTKTATVLAIMVICAMFVKIPFYPVPLTLQTTIAILAGFILGWKYGTIAMAMYMIMGLVGIPVFSGLPPSFAAIFKPSFGYVLGFVATAFVVGLLVKFVRRTFWNSLWIALVGVVTNYIIGLPYFMLIVQTVGIVGSEGLSAFSVTVLWSYNLIYLPKDIVLGVLATILSYKLLPYLQKEIE